MSEKGGALGSRITGRVADAAMLGSSGCCTSAARSFTHWRAMQAHADAMRGTPLYLDALWAAESYRFWNFEWPNYSKITPRLRLVRSD